MSSPNTKRNATNASENKPGKVKKDVGEALKAEKLARKANRSASKKGGVRKEDKKDAENWRNEG